MGWEKNRVDFVNASGAKAMNGVLNNAAVSEQGHPGEVLVRITDTAHGLLVDSQIMLPDIGANYDGLRTLKAAAVNTFDIHIPDVSFTALTPAGTELWYVGQTYTSAWEFIGYKISLSAAGGAVENLTIDVDANRGAAFDWNILTEPMNTVQDIVEIFEEPIPMEANDIIKVNYANSNDLTWAVQLMSRRLA